MYFYKISEHWLWEDFNSFWDYYYLIHDNKLTQEEFNNICKEVITKVTNSEDFLKELMQNYGFKPIIPTTEFEVDFTKEDGEV